MYEFDIHGMWQAANGKFMVRMNLSRFFNLCSDLFIFIDAGAYTGFLRVGNIARPERLHPSPFSHPFNGPTYTLTFLTFMVHILFIRNMIDIVSI